MPKVSNLQIKLMDGSDSEYFAWWDFNTTVKNTTTSSGVKKGDLVSIKTGATYYNGVAIPSWVMNDKWYILQVSGDRAVLGKNESGSNNIVSPINVKYLTGGTGSSSSTTTEGWSEDTVDHYEVHWYYATADGYFDGSSEDVEEILNSIYNPPENAIRIRVKVTPVAKTYKVNDEEVSYWTGTAETCEFSIVDSAPGKADAPSVEVEDYKLTAKLEGIDDVRADEVYFAVYNASTGAVVKRGNNIKVVTCAASWSCELSPGIKYRVRAAYNNKLGNENNLGEWSDYSEEVFTAPSAPSKFTSIKATSETSVRLEWAKVDSAETYDIEYAEKKEYFDVSNATTTQSGIESNIYELTNLATGTRYYFRVRSVNEKGESPWSDISSVAIGEPPEAPTTWSSTTTVITGEALNLYWVHNSADESILTYSQLEMYVDGVQELHTIKSTNTDEDENPVNTYSVDTSAYVEGTVIEWRVRTAGITNEYGDWSVQRTVDVYAPPTLELSITDQDETAIGTITSFPFYIKGLAGPNTQAPTGYHLVITSNSIYETVDNVGNFKMVNKGDEVYSKYFDTSDPLLVEFLASNIDLENNVTYTVRVTVSMDSGLTAESTAEFDVSWSDVAYEPNAEIGIDSDTYAAYIRPYCLDTDGNTVEGVTLSVYRRNFDGTFTEIATGIDPTANTFINDPHPALDYARYRVIATSVATGAISYQDIPPYPVGGKAVVIQWDDDWQDFNADEADELEQSAWIGSILKLPYNIDVSDNHRPDVSLIKYIGRSHPVSYYGTQLGTSATWNMQVVKSDTETLYALRRLASWMGDVYVREPSGSGYWANITVSFSQKHCELTIPVTFNITRVEGGV